MSGPNTNYDPVQVSALDEQNVAQRVDEALSAIEQATSTAQLKQVRLDHAGDRSPLARGSRALSALASAAMGRGTPGLW